MLLDLFFSHFFLFLHPVHMACGFCPLSKRVTLCAEGSSTGAASASTSANTAALPPGFSAANFPTGTIFVSAGAEANPSVAGAVSTDATLAPTSAAAAQVPTWQQMLPQLPQLLSLQPLQKFPVSVATQRRYWEQ